MKRYLAAFSAAMLLVATLAPVAVAKSTKVDICHYDSGTATYALLSVSDNSVAKHRAHGDALPGEAVPTMSGYTFDDACGAVADVAETIFAVVWTDMNGNHTYEAADDVLIAKLVDTNHSGDVDAGDTVITNKYPKGYDFATAGFGDFTVTTHTVGGVWYVWTDSITVWDADLGDPSAGGPAYYDFSAQYPLGDTGQYDGFLESGTGETTAMIDYSNNPAIYEDWINVLPGSPSAPLDEVPTVYQTSPANDYFIDVAINLP